MMVMLHGVPRVLATAWDSAGRQLSVIGQAYANGSVATWLARSWPGLLICARCCCPRWLLGLD